MRKTPPYALVSSANDAVKHLADRDPRGEPTTSDERLERIESIFLSSPSKDGMISSTRRDPSCPGFAHSSSLKSEACFAFAYEMIMSLDRQAYLSLRRPYEPDVVKLAIIAESPPASGKYFYNPAGSKSEPLFAALMKQLPLAPTSKEMGLREFQQRGWILVDATYEPVNAFGRSKRDEVIERDYPLLRADLSSLIPDKSTPVVLIKTNICRLLEPKLKQDGFNVLNRGRVIYFPAAGQQNEFQR
jgi:hypothetical protein